MMVAQVGAGFYVTRDSKAGRERLGRNSRTIGHIQDELDEVGQGKASAKRGGKRRVVY